MFHSPRQVMKAIEIVLDYYSDKYEYDEIKLKRLEQDLETFEFIFESLEEEDDDKN